MKQFSATKISPFFTFHRNAMPKPSPKGARTPFLAWPADWNTMDAAKLDWQPFKEGRTLRKSFFCVRLLSNDAPRAFCNAKAFGMPNILAMLKHFAMF
jgi:hypothetical protein